jgi:hypothetical protein
MESLGESKRIGEGLTGLDRSVPVKGSFLARAKGFIGADEAPRLTGMFS